MASKNVVLVHGGFVDGSGWGAARDSLKKDGYNVGVVRDVRTLSLEDDAAATGRVIDAQDGPVVLVAGGAVITEAGNNPKVAALVYIAAFAPDTGESVNTLIEGFPRTDRRADPAAAGRFPLPRREKAPRFVRGRRRRPGGVHGRLAGPWGLDALGGTISDAAWHNKPSWYLIATDDRMIRPAQHEMPDGLAQRLEYGASHSLYVSQPAAVAEVIKNELLRRREMSCEPTAVRWLPRGLPP